MITLYVRLERDALTHVWIPSRQLPILHKSPSLSISGQLNWGINSSLQLKGPKLLKTRLEMPLS
jgi:hypothetical protein